MANILPSRPRQFTSRRAFAVVASQYHAALVDGLIEHFRREIDVIAPGSNIAVYRVPGAFEIPLAVQEVAARGGVETVVAFGVIIEGETAHAALIGGSVTQSLQQIALAAKIPVIHEVLLVKNEAQAQARCLQEELNRGTEAARVAVQVAQTMSEIRR
jgi:6,7-dimethyl-8-ribityllumazine synthase